ncbi:hypothetical protein N9A94_08220 [Akkermansiaceae bacterium]|nr:hypothetical protein [Akkermansiaceae bacterium]
MERIHYLAAEIFLYSYDNYYNHLGVNARFDKLMPEEARLLGEALDGEFDAGELAAKLKISADELIDRLQHAKDARKIVDAKSPAEGFREAVKQSIRHAAKKGLTNESEIDALAGQICYRAADLSFLLKEKEERLEQYSEELREE